MSDSKAYCVGWLFTTDDTGVLNCKSHGIVLVHKKRPTWQRGKPNGIGGKLCYFRQGAGVIRLNMVYYNIIDSGKRHYLADF